MATGDTSKSKPAKRKDRKSLRERLIAALMKKATITLAPESEDAPYEEHCTHEGCDECHTWIRDQLDSGNEWAWCCAHVTVTWDGWSAEDYLGCCSYESAEAFKAGGYYEDMVRQCCTELADRMLALRDGLGSLLGEVL